MVCQSFHFQINAERKPFQDQVENMQRVDALADTFPEDLFQMHTRLACDNQRITNTPYLERNTFDAP